MARFPRRRFWADRQKRIQDSATWQHPCSQVALSAIGATCREPHPCCFAPGGTIRDDPWPLVCQSIGLAACMREQHVRYITSGELLEDLTAALADQTIHDRVRFYAKFSLLIIDEFGFDRIERSLCPQAASLWSKIIDARSQRASTALAT